MKKYVISIFFAVALCVIRYFHYQVGDFLVSLTGKKFILYLIYALFVGFFAVLTFKVLLTKKHEALAVLLLAGGLVFFLLITRAPFLAKLSILEFFLLGLLVSVENKKKNTLFPFILIFATCILAEVAGNLSENTGFYYLDVWRSALIALSGYVPGSLLL